jgi:hypothetical protein
MQQKIDNFRFKLHFFIVKLLDDHLLLLRWVLDLFVEILKLFIVELVGVYITLLSIFFLVFELVNFFLLVLSGIMRKNYKS